MLFVHAIKVNGFVSENDWGCRSLSNRGYTAYGRIGVKQSHAVIYVLVDFVIVLLHKVHRIMPQTQSLIIISKQHSLSIRNTSEGNPIHAIMPVHSPINLS
jgi:hypothetical protein